VIGAASASLLRSFDAESEESVFLHAIAISDG